MNRVNSSHNHRHNAVFVFPGFGSQWKTMGSGLMSSSPIFREAIHRCSSIFRELSGWSIEEEIMREKELSRIEDAHTAPFCIFAVQSALIDMLKHWGIVPSAVLGHSMGEISAAYCAGILETGDALKVIQACNELIDHGRGKGCMIQINLPSFEIQHILETLSCPLFIAAINSPLSTVVAGEEASVEKLLKVLEKRDVFFRILKNDAPMHTPLMGGGEHSPALSQVRVNPPVIPVYSTVHGRRAEHEDFSPQYWNLQLSQPILFTGAIDSALEDGYETFIEISPHPVLSGLIEECFQRHPGKKLFSCGTLKRDEEETAELMKFLQRMKAEGFDLDFTALSQSERETLADISDARKAGPEISRVRDASENDVSTGDTLQGISDKKKSIAPQEPIAIIGIGCRYPGGAKNPQEYWELLKRGDDAVVEIPEDRWDKEYYYDPDPEITGKMFTKSGGFLKEGVYDFDPHFFSISPKEALSMDPQQRLLMEVCWEAVENAGIDAADLKESNTGVFIGISCDDYEGAHRHSGDFSKIDAYSITGSTFSIVAGRVSYFMGLQGPAYIVDTACSSTLVALHCACQSLRTGESDLAIAGGVNLILSPEVYICFTKLKALSPDGRCKTFDASANGYCRGEGCGVLVLKRLRDALRDNDRILAVVKGTAINQDGRSTGITAPNGLAQQKVIRMAMNNAGITSSDVDYIEAHGTGTPLGDPIELEAIGAAFRDRGTDCRKVYVGSVKTNIGHLESAAGSAGLLKIILALQNEEIPPNLHFKTPTPHVKWNEIPVEIVTQMTPWPRSSRPRIAGISAFGFSGTNVHIILEEAPERTSGKAAVERPCHILTISARDEKALMEQIDSYRDFLAGSSESSPADICHTSGTGRFHFDLRAFAVGDTLEELNAGLSSLKEKRQWLQQGETNRSIAFLFSGQGSQYTGMGHVLYETSPVFREALDQCDSIIRSLTGRSIIEIIDEDTDVSPLHETQYTQPAIFSIEYALFRLWKSWGIEPSCVLGHSIGEYAAACAAGVFTLEEALKLVAARGRLMQSIDTPGTMASISATEREVMEAVKPFEKSVSIAAVNGPESIVISGEKAHVEEISNTFRENGRRVKILKVSHAFHSPIMDCILEEFERVASEIHFCRPSIPLISNLTGKIISPEEVTKPAYWRDHIRRAVRFHDSMKTLESMEYELFVELGGDSTLSSLGMQCLDSERSIFLPSLKKDRDEWKTILGSLGTLYTRGINIDWQGFDRPYSRSRVTIPTYPFQRKRYFLNPVAEQQKTGEGGTVSREAFHPFIGQKITSPALQNAVVFQTIFSEEKPRFLEEHMMFGATVSPGAAHLSMMLSALAFHHKQESGILEEVNFLLPLIVTENEKRTVQLILTPLGKNRDSVLIASSGSHSEWDTHCTGILTGYGEGSPRRTELDLSGLKSRCRDRIDMEELYGRLKKIGCNLGPEFRCIEELFYNRSEFLGRLRKKKNISDSADYQITPGLIDSILQVMLLSSAWAIRKVGENQSLFIPFHVGKMAVHSARLPDEFWCYCTFRETEEMVAGDITVFDEKGSLYMEITDLIAKYTDNQAFLRGSIKSRLNVLYTESWVEEKQSSPLPGDGSSMEGEACIIFHDRQGLGEKLGALMQQRGAQVLRVLAADEYSSPGDNLFQVNPALKEDFRRLFQEIISTGPSRVIKSILFLWPLDSGSSDLLTTEALEKEQRLMLESLLHMAQTLASLDLPCPPRIRAVTSNAQKVNDSEAVKSIAETPLWGFGRTISQEMPQLWGGLIDIDSTVLFDEPLAVLREIVGGGDESLLALRGGNRRFAARLKKMTELPVRDNRQNPIPTEGTVLITGGMGALGIALAEWLVKKGCRHIAITSRKSVSSERMEKMDSLREMGAEIEILVGDISRMDDAFRMVSQIHESMPPLKGVFHLAGMLDDGMIEEMDWERFSRVLAPKISGAWNLHLLSRDLELDFFVMYSSASSLLGNPGQSSYAAGNAFLDGLASYRRGIGLPALSINWSSWADAGMAASKGAEHDRLAHYGVRHLKPDFALELLDSLLNSRLQQVCALDIDWETYRDRLEQKSSSYLCTILPKKAEEAGDREEETREKGIMAALQETPPVKRKEALIQYMQRWSARIMGCDDPRQVKTDTPLMEQGVDSLMIVEMRNKFNREVKTTLPMTLLFNYPTLKKVADYILGNILTFQDTPDAKEAQPPSTDDLLNEIDALVKRS